MKNWIIYPKKSDDIVEQLLANRTIKDRKSFLNPQFQDLHDPFLLKGMDKAVKRIKKSLKSGEKIGIFADYDADGIPGAALLYRAFHVLGVCVETYIPSRDEGYGLNKVGIKKLADKGCKLLITVDLGVSNKEEVVFAQKLGLDVIVTDHHEIQKEKIPASALAVLHPRLSPEYPFKDLSGGGVAFKLVQAMSKVIKKPTENQLKWLLDLAAISTICDVVPLIGENRIIAKYGLIVLNKTKNLGLLTLYRMARIENQEMDPYTVGFRIGPRINAPGRMEHASPSFNLLITEDPDEAEKIAMKLEKVNSARQQELNRVLTEAKKIIKKRGLEKQKVILVEGQNWPLGIIGLVAGKLAEEYARPVLVLRNEKGKLDGSGRSTEKFHLLDALGRARAYLTRHGGHARAAGLSLELKHLDLLYDILILYAERKLKTESLIPEIKIDCEINTEKINYEFVGLLKQFEPFGLANPRPVFLVKNIRVCKKSLVGLNKKHLKLYLQSADNRYYFDSIGFDLGSWAKDLLIGDKVDIVCTLDEDRWNGIRKIQLKILDLRKGEESLLKHVESILA